LPNIGVVLKDEISRLCRREIRKEVAGTKRATALYRREIASLKRKVAELERKEKLHSKAAAAAVASQPAQLPDRPVRFVAKGLRTLRARLGLSAAQLAKLIQVSEQSVYNWEMKKAVPRKEPLAAIISLRSIGKREALARLQALKESKPKDSGKRDQAAALARKTVAKKAVSKKSVAKKASTKKLPARYANPKDPALKWSGHGKRPNWFKVALKAGSKPENMLIKKPAAKK